MDDDYDYSYYHSEFLLLDVGCTLNLGWCHMSSASEISFSGGGTVLSCQPSLKSASSTKSNSLWLFSTLANCSGFFGCASGLFRFVGLTVSGCLVLAVAASTRWTPFSPRAVVTPVLVSSSTFWMLCCRTFRCGLALCWHMKTVQEICCLWTALYRLSQDPSTSCRAEHVRHEPLRVRMAATVGEFFLLGHRVTRSRAV